MTRDHGSQGNPVDPAPIPLRNPARLEACGVDGTPPSTGTRRDCPCPFCFLALASIATSPWRGFHPGQDLHDAAFSTPMMPEATRACCLLVALSAATPSCPAQDRDRKTTTSAPAYDLIPADTHIVLSIEGPAALARSFAGTRALKMIESDALAGLVRKHWRPFEPRLRQRLEEHSFDLDTLLGQLRDYTGSLVVTFHLDDDDGAIDFSRPPQIMITVLLGPDGRIPLEDICGKLVEAIREQQAERIEEVEFEGRTFPELRTRGRERNHLLLPFMHRRHLCLLFCSDPKEALRRLLNPEQKPTYRPGGRLAGKGLFVDVNLRSLMGLMRESLRRLDEREDGDWTRLFDDLGLRCLERLALTAGARPPYVVQEIRLQLNDRNLGLLSALFPDRPGRSPLLSMMPGDIQSAQAFFLSLPRLHAAAERALEDRTDLPFRFASLEEGFEATFGLRLKEDVLDHLGGHMVLMEDLAAEREEDRDERDLFNPVAEVVQEVSPYCLAVSLRDAGAFDKSVERMVRKRGLHAARKTRDYKGFKMREISLAGVALHYTVTGRTLLVALGDGGGTRAMRSALDRESRVARGEEPLPLRKEVRDRVAIAPDGHYGLGYDDLVSIFAALRSEYDRAREMMEEHYEGGLEEALRRDASLRAWVPLMTALLDFSELFRPFDLGTQAKVLRYRGREIVQRVIW